MTESHGEVARYGTGARFFHWLTVLLFLAQVPAGIAMVVPAMIGDFPVLPGVEQRTVDVIYIFHKGLGAILLVVVFARVIWRLTHPAPPLPESIPAMERKIAFQGHTAMYVLMVIAVVTGYVHVVGLGFPMELMNYLGIPTLLPRMEKLAVICSFTHRFTVIFLMGVVAIHIAEVYRNQWVEKNGVLYRMWPPFGKPPADAFTKSESAAGGAGAGARH